MQYRFFPPPNLVGLSLFQKILFQCGKFYNALPPHINSLPNNKILDLSKLKAFADDKNKVIEKLKFDMGRVENLVGKEENAGYQHFLLFPQCFQKLSFVRSLKVVNVW